MRPRSRRAHALGRPLSHDHLGPKLGPNLGPRASRLGPNSGPHSGPADKTGQIERNRGRRLRAALDQLSASRVARLLGRGLARGLEHELERAHTSHRSDTRTSVCDRYSLRRDPNLELDAEHPGYPSDCLQRGSLVSILRSGDSCLAHPEAPPQLGLADATLRSVPEELDGDETGDGGAVPLGPEGRVLQMTRENLLEGDQSAQFRAHPRRICLADHPS